MLRELRPVRPKTRPKLGEASLVRSPVLRAFCPSLNTFLRLPQKLFAVAWRERVASRDALRHAVTLRTAVIGTISREVSDRGPESPWLLADREAARRA